MVCIPGVEYKKVEVMKGARAALNGTLVICTFSISFLFTHHLEIIDSTPTLCIECSMGVQTLFNCDYMVEQTWFEITN
jgi:hypothetical protein